MFQFDILAPWYPGVVPLSFYWYATVTCFCYIMTINTYYSSSGAQPNLIKLCRRDKTTIAMHLAHHHPQEKNILVKPYNDSSQVVKSAWHYIESQKLEEKVNDKTKAGPATPVTSLHCLQILQFLCNHARCQNLKHKVVPI